MGKTMKKMWAKMILNSSFGFPPQPIIPIIYDENKRIKITEEGKKNLKLIQDTLDNIL